MTSYFQKREKELKSHENVAQEKKRPTVTTSTFQIPDPESSQNHFIQNEKSGILFPQALKVVFRKLNYETVNAKCVLQGWEWERETLHLLNAVKPN